MECYKVISKKYRYGTNASGFIENIVTVLPPKSLFVENKLIAYHEYPISRYSAIYCGK